MLLRSVALAILLSWFLAEPVVAQNSNGAHHRRQHKPHGKTAATPSTQQEPAVIPVPPTPPDSTAATVPQEAGLHLPMKNRKKVVIVPAPPPPPGREGVPQRP